MKNNIRLMASTGGRVLDELLASLEAAQNAILASAFVSSSGIALLLPSIERLLGRGGTLHLYVTFDGGAFTHPKFFEMLEPLERRFPSQVEVYLYPNSSSLFHAKTFLFERADRSWFGIVGSANLTHSALNGDNFEVVAVAGALDHAEVVGIRDELSSLRTAGYFTRFTPALYSQVSGNKLDVQHKTPEERDREERQAKGKRELVRQALDRVKPTPLSPLPLLALPGAVYVENLCATGMGVATDDDLADLSVSVDLGVFIRAGVLAKESTKKIGFVSENTKKGHSFSLIDESVRETVKTARKSIGKTIGLRAVDFGYLRWVPHLLYGDALRAIAANPNVTSAMAAVAPGNASIAKHINTVKRSFAKNMATVVGTLKLQPKDEWDAPALSNHGISVAVSGAKMREYICEHIIERNRARVSEPLVRSQLARLTFAPRAFAFPLTQSHGGDAHYGHKHFLANLIWTCTDRLLKRTTEDGGTGVLFEYLDARRQLNKGRHGRNAEELAGRAAAWLDQATPLEAVVAEFREAYGPEPFTWELGDLAQGFAMTGHGRDQTITSGEG